MNLYVKKIYRENRIELLLLLVYFMIHLSFLTTLPIFNDESIYLDWGWSFTHMQGHLYDSLLDAKQPLMIWMFGVSERFFADPLFAGRVVSVLIGSISLIGIYAVTRRMFDKNFALIAGLLYTIIPIFIFYNRQALMESAISCVGIWSFYFLLTLIKKPTVKNGVILGIILGVGFFIKSSSLLFIIPVTNIILFYIFVKKKSVLLNPLAILFSTIFLIDFLLIINPLFWQTLSTNSRYAFTFSELFSLPFSSWIHNVFGFFEIGFFFFTPVLFCCSIAGIFLMYKKQTKYNKIFFLYFMIALGLEILGGRFQSQRYLVPFLPFLVIPAAYILHLLWVGNIWKKFVVVIACLLAFIFSLTLIVNPKEYITQTAKMSPYAESLYIAGQTSGYRINEVMDYIKLHTSASKGLVLFALNAGNPENAINLYSQRDTSLYPFHINKRFFPEIEKYDCLQSRYPTFFVTRNDELSGLQNYFELEKSFPNSDGKYSIRVYALKKNCHGRTTSLSDFYGPAMPRIDELR